MRSHALLAVALLAETGTAACTGDLPTDPDPISIGGRLAIHLIAGAAEELPQSAISLDISGIRFKPGGQPEERIAIDVGEVDVLTLTDAATPLASAPAGEGGYELITVELGDESWIGEWTDGGGDDTTTVSALQVPDHEIRIPGDFEVSAAMTSTLTLEIDIDNSMTRLADGSWRMPPVIALADISQS